MELILKAKQENTRKLYESTCKDFVQSNYFNLFCINEVNINGNCSVEIDLGIIVSLKELSKSLSLKLYKNKACWIIPTDYLSKTTLMCVNSPIVSESNKDSLTIKIYNYGKSPFTIKRGHQFFRIVSLDLSIINKVVVS